MPIFAACKLDYLAILCQDWSPGWGQKVLVHQTSWLEITLFQQKLYEQANYPRLLEGFQYTTIPTKTKKKLRLKNGGGIFLWLKTNHPMKGNLGDRVRQLA